MKETSTRNDRNAEADFSSWRGRLLNRWGMRCDVGSSAYAWSNSHNWDCGRVNITSAEVGPQAWTSVRQHSAQTKWRKDSMILKLVHAGAVALELDGRRECFGPGSAVLVDGAANYRETFEQATQLTVVALSKPALLERGFRCSTGGFFAADPAAADVGALREFVLYAARQGEAPSTRVRERLGEQLLDTVDIVTDLAAVAPRTRSSHATLFRAKYYIQQHLGDPALDPEQVAMHAYASIDHLHRLFREEGTTLMGYVWRARLAKAKHLLLQAAGGDHAPIGQIALQCGFSAHAHFSRMFRRQYGVSPTELIRDRR
jgi:AraC-like DNA-binding protein